MSAIELTVPFGNLSEEDRQSLGFVTGKKPRSHTSAQSYRRPLTPVELFAEEMRKDTVPLESLLDAAGIDHVAYPHKKTRLIEYQCAVLSNSFHILEGAKTVESLVDVKIKRVEPPKEMTPEDRFLRELIGLGDQKLLPRSITETDLDVVTIADGKVHPKEVAASGKNSMTEKQHNVGKGEAKPSVVVRAFDGAELNGNLYRIPREVVCADSYTVIIPPHKRIAEEVFEYIRSTAFPLVQKYSRNADGETPSISVVYAPVDWSSRIKRWHNGMPQQTPEEIAKLAEQLERIPRNGFRVKETLANLEDYRGSSSPLFLSAYSSQ